tara:strand:+ start:215 stop:373 length:159 start_codon:yes stop_codon:yes gene_type:complete
MYYEGDMKGVSGEITKIENFILSDESKELSDGEVLDCVIQMLSNLKNKLATF